MAATEGEAPHRICLTDDGRVQLQQKLLAAALLMAQVKLFPEDAPVQPCLLLDDPAAELDDARLTGLIREVSMQSMQLIVTTLHGEFSALGAPGRRFRMDAGRVEAL